MLENWLPILIFALLITGFAVTTLIMSWFAGVHKPTPQKLSPYESGMKPVGSARDRVSIQFYMVAMLCLLFDVEVIFLFPWAIVYRELDMFGFWEMLCFIGVILAGYIYVWKKGALEWEE